MKILYYLWTKRKPMIELRDIVWICLPKRYWKSCRDILEMVDLSTRGFVYSIVPELAHCSHVDLSTDGGFVYQRCWFVYKPMWICLQMVDLSTGSLWSIVHLSTARGFVYRAACGAVWICLHLMDLSTRFVDLSTSRGFVYMAACAFVYSLWNCLQPGGFVYQHYFCVFFLAYEKETIKN